MSTILGQGKTGIVVAPALNNINNSGRPIRFPINVVSKMYLDKETYEDEFRRTVDAFSKLGYNDEYKINVYKKQLKGKNLPEQIKRTYPDVRNTNDVYGIRMKNLGINLKSVSTKLDLIKKIPIHIIFEQIYKLIQQIDKLNSSGYIHGDIFQENIMINPENGNMNLIDFQRFGTKENFFTNNLQEYFNKPYFGRIISNPPEFLNIREYGYGNLKEKIIKDLPFVLFDYLPNFFTKYYITSKNRFIYYFMNDIYLKNKETLYRFFIDEYNKPVTPDKFKLNVIKNFLSFYDSYGLGISLLNFLFEIFGDVYDNSDGANYLKTNNFTKNGVKYSDKEYEIYLKYLNNVIELLLGLGEFEYTERIHISIINYQYNNLLINFYNEMINNGFTEFEEAKKFHIENPVPLPNISYLESKNSINHNKFDTPVAGVNNIGPVLFSNKTPNAEERYVPKPFYPSSPSALNIPLPKNNNWVKLSNNSLHSLGNSARKKTRKYKTNRKNNEKKQRSKTMKKHN
jgi:serine/threonine protein kinase